MSKPKQIFLFANGNTAAFDDQDQQILELSNPWIILFIQFLEEKGIDPETIDFYVPDVSAKIRIFRCNNSIGWNWQINEF